VIVACATDRRFAQLAGVMLASLFDKGEVGDWRVVVFGYRLRPRDKAKLRQSCGTNGDRLEFIDVDPHSPMLTHLLPTRFGLSPAPYLRMLMPALLGDALGRLIYLDADTLVLSSLRPLADLDLQGCVLAAAEDHESTHPAKDGRLPFPPDQPSFNSGVLVFDLERWRNLDLSRRAFQFLVEHEDRLAFADQDVLNCILVGQWKALPPGWNFTHHRARAAGGCDGAHIAHFTGGKPWSADCGHPAQELFLRYRAQTPWRHRRLSTRLERRIAKLFYKRMRRLKGRWGSGSA
jgi:lipopolysaccharide biosynthesis glycosyltransferase